MAKTIIDLVGLAVCAAIVTAGLHQAGFLDQPRPALIECYPAPAVYKRLSLTEMALI